jgi:excisionase family DNA binding protein
MAAGQNNSEYMDVQKLSEYLEMKASTLYSLAEQKKIPHYKVGRLVRFKKSDIDLWMETNKKEVIDVSKAAKFILKTGRRPACEVNKVVKKAIDDVKGFVYTPSHGKPDQVKGLGKEVHDGSV